MPPDLSFPPVSSRLARPLPPERWLSDLRQAASTQVAWLWHGYLAAGSVTLLTSQWKSGKTTLLALLLDRMKHGGELAGRALTAGKAVVVSEEGEGQWERRSQKLDLDGHVCWFCRPFPGKPSLEEWLALLDRIVELDRQHGLRLAVIDPLATFLPGRDESSAGTMMEALAPLQRLTNRGLSVLLLHHPRKREGPAGMAARGSGALSGFVDILLEMDWYRRGAEDDRRRRLRAYSRFEETPRQLVIELNPEGTAYTERGDFQGEAFTKHWQRLRMVLEDAKKKLTRRQVLAEWPPDFDKPDPATLWAWLTRAVADGRVLQEGTGRKNSPFRYWLPGQEEKWREECILEPLPELEPLKLKLAAALLERKARQGKRKEHG